MQSGQDNYNTERGGRSAQCATFRKARSEFRIPELLAPAGDWECARAAVENGADAIYFGLDKFNARMRARNFTEADLPELMAFLHRRGVKGYVAFNTLVFEDEMASAEGYLRAMIAAGVDAVIVQDVGICRLIRQISPDFPIHVSTQMTVTSAAGVQFAQELGCDLVVLARECSIKEIEKIREGCQGSRIAEAASDTRPSKPGPLFPPLPLEVFVHGALCVAYSGQCLTSEALGGRSANRGECAQACRMPYDLMADGKHVNLGDQKYLLSPQDLAGLDVLPELVRAGVSSLKIEGRLKSPEYVASITKIYRNELDKIATGEAGVANSHSAPRLSTPDPQHYEMEMAFSRGLYTGWLHGINNQQLVHARFGKKRGVYLGEVAEVERNGIIVQLVGPLKPGDGVVFDAGKPEEREEGGRVTRVGQASGRPAEQPRGKPTLLSFLPGAIDFTRIHPGDKVWKTSDPQLEKRLHQSYVGDEHRFQRPLRMEVAGCAGKPLALIARDELGREVCANSSMPLEQATRAPLTEDRLRSQLGRLGGTPFRLTDLHNLLEGDVVLPVSELNRLRRQIVDELTRLRQTPKKWTTDVRQQSNVLQSADIEPDKRSSSSLSPLPSYLAPRLTVLTRSLEQLDAALESGVTTLYCDFEDPKKYREAVARTRAMRASIPDVPRELFVAPPRIFKTGEEWTLKLVKSSEADGYLVRNYDHLKFFATDRCIGDYSLNIANRLAADYFRNRFNLERLTASYDLNVSQLDALLRAAPPEWFEITIHQHVPMFHMEHCVFCAFLSTGTDYTNCGRPCDRHDLKLRDRVGVEHPVRADAGCRNTVFNGRAQTGAEYVARMIELGVRYFRVEFVNETADQVARIIREYKRLLIGEVSGAEVWRGLKLVNQLGVTRGQLMAK